MFKLRYKVGVERESSNAMCRDTAGDDSVALSRQVNPGRQAEPVLIATMLYWRVRAPCDPGVHGTLL